MMTQLFRRREMHNIVKVALCMAMAFALLAFVPAAQAQKGPGWDDPNDWPQYHRSYNAWRFSPLDQINKHNIKNLKVAWIHQPGDVTYGLQATPIVIDGVLYYISPNNNVWAVNAATGTVIWHVAVNLDPISKETLYAAASRGVTVGRGKVFVGTLDGRMVALDQKTGKQIWSTQLTDMKTEFGAVFSSPPQLAGNILFGGTTGGDQPTIGKIYGVNADTGERVWTFEVPKDDPKSWPGDSRKTAGSGAWLPGTYDPTTDTIYIGTSNANPDFYRDERVGDNLYSATVLALDPQTGKIKWYRQETPNDSWDFGSPYEALLFPYKGKTLLAHMSKSGFTYIMDKDTGELENVYPYAETITWNKGIDPKTGEIKDPVYPEVGKEKLICPELLGGRQWNPGAYNPKTGLWYVPGFESCNLVTATKQEFKGLPIAGLSLGVSSIKLVDPPGKKAYGYFAARDPYTGKKKWEVKYDLPPLCGVVATAGGLVFTGDARGFLYAYDDETGKELWKFNAGSGCRGGPVSYKANGKQYIVFPTGYGSLSPGFLSGLFPDEKNLPFGAALIAFEVGN
jgi:alcohol dehydrogenase (cytochrome c)